MFKQFRQEVLHDKIIRLILTEINKIRKLSQKDKVTFSEVEECIQKILSKIGWMLMSYAVKELCEHRQKKAQSRITLSDGSKVPIERYETRQLKTLYGEVRLTRGYYWSKEAKGDIVRWRRSLD